MFSSLVSGGIDAFLRVSVAGSMDVDSGVRTVHLAQDKDDDKDAPVLLTVGWYEELRIPVLVPVRSNVIQLSVMDWDLKPTGHTAELVAGTRLKYSAIKHGAYAEPRWMQLYGAAVDRSMLATGNKAERRRQMMVPSAGTHNRGRILFSARIERPAEGNSVLMQRVPLALQSRMELIAEEPPLVKYTLTACFEMATELQPRSASEFSLRVCVGRYHFDYQVGTGAVGFVKSDGNVHHFSGKVMKQSLELPCGVDELPDVIVYLVYKKALTKNKVTASLRRFKAGPLLRTPTDGGLELKWLELDAEKAVSAVPKGSFPGMLLGGVGLSVGVVPGDDYVTWQKKHVAAQQPASESTPAASARMSSNTKQRFAVRLHLYQGRNLPPKDKNGLLDPYVSMRLGDVHVATKRGQMRETCNPVWHESLSMDQLLTMPDTQGQTSGPRHHPDKSNSWPLMKVDIMDWDRGLKEKDDHAGSFFVDLEEEFHRCNDERMELGQIIFMEPVMLKPRWRKLFDSTPGDMDIGQGHCTPAILCSVEVTMLLDIEKNLRTIPPALPFNLDTVEAEIEIVTLGLRDLQPFLQTGLRLPHLAVNKPFVQFSLCDGTADLEKKASRKQHRMRTVQERTLSSNKPTAVNPNYLKRVRIRCRLPRNPDEVNLHAPWLNIAAIDTRFGELQKDVIGTAGVPLASFIPWGTTFKAPTNTIEAAASAAGSTRFIGQDAPTPAPPAAAESAVVLQAEAEAQRPLTPEQHAARSTVVCFAQQLPGGVKWFLAVDGKGGFKMAKQPGPNKSNKAKKSFDSRVAFRLEALEDCDEPGYLIESLATFNSKKFVALLPSGLSEEQAASGEQDVKCTVQLDCASAAARIGMEITPCQSGTLFSGDTSDDGPENQYTISAVVMTGGISSDVVMSSLVMHNDARTGIVSAKSGSGAGCGREPPPAQRFMLNVWRRTPLGIEEPEEEKLEEQPGEESEEESEEPGGSLSPLPTVPEKTSGGGGAVSSFPGAQNADDAANSQPYSDVEGILRGNSASSFKVAAGGGKFRPDDLVEFIRPKSSSDQRKALVHADSTCSNTAQDFPPSPVPSSRLEKLRAASKGAVAKLSGKSAGKDAEEEGEGAPFCEPGWVVSYDASADVYVIRDMLTRELVEDVPAEDVIKGKSKVYNFDYANDAYKIDRAVVETELEDVLGGQPFDVLPLHLGKGRHQRETGQFKGLIRVRKITEAPPAPPEPVGMESTVVGEDEHPLALSSVQFSDEAPLLLQDEQGCEDGPALEMDLERLLAPQPYLIRVYVIKGENLKDMDAAFLGTPGASDPYLKVKLGPKHQDSRARFQNNEPNPFFGEVFEFPSHMLPGESKLEIGCWDADTLTKDDLIGSTTIDLEDRLFCPKWQALGLETTGANRLRRLPLESRSLFNPTDGGDWPTGTLQLWIDVLDQADALRFPREIISLSKPLKVEMRLVIWRTKGTPSGETSGLNDLFIRVRYKATDMERSTDIHWRAAKGKANFNYRMCFPLELRTTDPMSDHFKRGEISVQLVDKDVLKWDDTLAENSIDLRPFLRKVVKMGAFAEAERRGRGSRVMAFASATPESEVSTYEDPGSNEKAKQKESEIESVFEDGQLATLLGGKVDPPNSQWVDLKTADGQSAGQILLGLEFVPQEDADSSPLGEGRKEPNHSPFLPPPPGRFHFSMNPFMML
jgi:hypothetical protein